MRAVIGRLVLLTLVATSGCNRPGAATNEPAPNADAAPAKTASDLDRLQGTWLLESLIGKDAPKELVGELKGAGVKIEGNTLTFFNETGEQKKTFTLNVENSPKEITLAPSEATEEGPPMPEVPGIYELEGDVLKLSFAEVSAKVPSLAPGVAPKPEDYQTQVGERPTTFEGDEAMATVLRRKKP